MLAELTAAIDARDPAMHGHSVRVAELAGTIGEALGWAAEKLAAIHLGGLLHDVGKLAVSSHLLAKPGPLAPDELAAIRSHPIAGAKLLESFADARPALACVLFHHERWDGSGYPTGRGGHDIPLDARVLAIADAYDAMTTARPYRRALTSTEARAEIARCAGTQFDPMLAVLFLELWNEDAAATAAAS
jgi:putative nucleotidyltransferase with HDIG domain